MVLMRALLTFPGVMTVRAEQKLPVRQIEASGADKPRRLWSWRLQEVSSLPQLGYQIAGSSIVQHRTFRVDPLTETVSSSYSDKRR